MRAHGFSRPYPGLRVCGDDFVILPGAAHLTIGVIDGLGHGADAAHAASLARRVLVASPDAEPEALLMLCHEALRGSRGAALAVVRVAADGAGVFCGVGNIELRTLVGTPQSVFCIAGIVGHNVRRMRPMPFRVAPGDVHCLLTDGVQTRADLAPCLTGERAGWAERIVTTFGRAHDDATAVVLDLVEEGEKP